MDPTAKNDLLADACPPVYPSRAGFLLACSSAMREA
jgi:hypothetical protein